MSNRSRVQGSEVVGSQQIWTVYSWALKGERTRMERFEDIEAWRLARELAHKVYGLIKKAKFALNFGLKGQIQDAAGLPR